ncbi:deoxyribonuclease IV [Candidatus Roizmanbacteria bacterium]|nr:deoxyribonuclease IV [Candidatus Roizmanbacteria bacterium]
MNYRLGAHLSTAGGYCKAIEKALIIGANTLQIFSTSPRSWKPAEISPEDVTAFREAKLQSGVNPVFFHASYLINLTDSGETGKLSKVSLIRELQLAAQMDIIGSIVHTGSYKGEYAPEKFQTLISNITEILNQTPENTILILENSGNKKIGVTIDEIGEIISVIGNSRLKLCLDTCHLHAAGYDLSTPEEFDRFLIQLEKTVGLDRLAAFHINDSKDAFHSYRDRHENIGKGQIPSSVFKHILSDNRTCYIPLILEVPGLEGKGPDKENLDVLKSFIHQS